MTMMGVQAVHNIRQDMTGSEPQPSTIRLEEDKEERILSIEQLFNLYMEANKEVRNAMDLLNRTSPNDAFYNDLSSILETVQLKRDNYQLGIVSRARQSKGSLDYLKTLGAKRDSKFPPRNNVNGTREEPVEDVQEKNDISLAVRRRRVNTVVDSSSESESESTIAPTESTVSEPVSARDQSRDRESHASDKSNVDGQPSSSAIPAVGTNSKVTEKESLSSSLPLIPLKPSLPPQTTDLPTTTNNAEQRNSSTSTGDSNSDSSPEPVPSIQESTSTSIAPQPTETDTLVAPLLNTSRTKIYTSDEIDVILKAIGETSIEVSQAHGLIISLLDQLRKKPVAEAVPRVSSLIIAPSKNHYGTEKDLRYFIIDQIIKSFSSRQDVMDGLAADKTLMMRTGNWLRWEQRQKNDESGMNCLAFFESLGCTTKQLTEFKVLDVLSRIAKRESLLSAPAQKIMDDAAAKQSLLNPSDKRSFSVSDYVTQTKRKVSATSETADSGIVANEVHLTPKEPTLLTGEVKSILRAPNSSSGSKKSVKFKSDNVLVEVQYFESDQHAVHHTVQEDQKKARKMDMDEGRLLKGAQDSPNTPHDLTEIDMNPWVEPPLISFDIGEAFVRSLSSITRGGTMPLEPFENTLPKPRAHTGLPRDSPFEPEGLVTPHMTYEYFDGGRSVLISNPQKSSPATPHSALVNNGVSNPTEEQNDIDPKKRARETDVWTPDYDQSKRQRSDEVQDNYPQPHRQGVLGTGLSIRSKVPLPPQDSTARDDHPTELNKTIIQWRMNDTREKVRKGARTFPPSIHSEGCAYYPNCRWGNGCRYIHFNGRKAPPASTKRSKH